MRTPLKTLGLILVILVTACTAAAVQHFTPKRVKWRLMNACFQGMMNVIGLRVKVTGELAADRPLLLVTNHSSYLDILILGANLPVRFTPKAEIGKWPVIGSLCRLIECVFIDRRVHRTRENQARLRAAMEEGAVISLYPEGTTGDGTRVLPFRSSYFSLAEERFDGKALTVQPAAIRYTRISGMPIDSGQRPQVAWYGDMDLVPHAAELMRLGIIDAELIFLPPVDITQFEGRKALAAYCQQAIEKALENKGD